MTDDSDARLPRSWAIGMAVAGGVVLLFCLVLAALLGPWLIAADQEQDFQRRVETPQSVSPS